VNADAAAFWTEGSGDSTGSRFEEVPMGLWPKAAQGGEGGAPPVPGEPRASFGLWGF
jgi:hypothetical protein